MKTHLKKVLGIYLKIFFAVLTFAAFVVMGFYVYKTGVVKGYNEAQKDINEQIASILENYSQSVSPTPTETLPLPTVKITPVPTKTVNHVKDDWGGPELWEAVNNKRTEYGVNPLSQRDDLCTIASIRLNELLELGKLDGHEGFSNMEVQRPDLAWIFDKYSTMAEFLAVGGKTAEETVSLWEGTLGYNKLLTGGEYVWGCIYAQNTFAVAITAF